MIKSSFVLSGLGQFLAFFKLSLKIFWMIKFLSFNLEPLEEKFDGVNLISEYLARGETGDALDIF